jgi:hypothetical protein
LIRDINKTVDLRQTLEEQRTISKGYKTDLNKLRSGFEVIEGQTKGY